MGKLVGEAVQFGHGDGRSLAVVDDVQVSRSHVLVDGRFPQPSSRAASASVTRMGEEESWVVVLECMKATLHGRWPRREGLTTLSGALSLLVAHLGEILRECRGAWGVGLSRHLLHRQTGPTLPP